jgi:hypothetical protein
MDKTFFILCDARSGSSLLGGVLSKLGVNMGDNLKEGSLTNPKGYYEDRDLQSLAANLLNREPTEAYKGAKEYLEEKDDKYVGLKTGNGKLTKAFKFFEPHAEGIHIIVPHRDTEEQIASMMTSIDRNKSYETFKERLEENYELIDEVAGEYPRLDIDFDDWFKTPAKQVEKICDFTGLDYSEEAVNFVDPNLRNFGN